MQYFGRLEGLRGGLDLRCRGVREICGNISTSECNATTTSSCPPFTDNEAVHHMRDMIAKVMTALHRHNICHRDLKAWYQESRHSTTSVHQRVECTVYSYAMTCYEILTDRIPFEELRSNDRIWCSSSWWKTWITQTDWAVDSKIDETFRKGLHLEILL